MDYGHIEEQAFLTARALRALHSSILIIDLTANLCYEIPAFHPPYLSEPHPYGVNISTALTSFVVPADAKRISDALSRESLKQIIESNEPLTDRFAVHLDGTPDTTHSLEIMPLSDASDKVVVFIKDITFFAEKEAREHSKSLTELATKHDEQLRFVLDFSGIDYGEYDVENDTARIGAKTAERYGFSSHVITDFFKKLLIDGSIHPDDRKKFHQMFEAVRNGAPFAESEVRTLNKDDGRYKWMKYRLRTFFTDGKPATVIGTGVATDDFRRIEEVYAQVCEQNNLAVWYVDVPSRSVHDTYGITYFGIVEDGVRDIDKIQLDRGQIHPDDVSTYRQMYKRVWAGEESITGQLRRWSKHHNRFIWFEYHFTSLESESGRAITLLGTARDISAEKEKEEAFEAAQNVQYLKDKGFLSYTRVNLTAGMVEDATRAKSGIVAENIKNLPTEFRERAEGLVSRVLTPGWADGLSTAELKDSFDKGITSLHSSYWAILSATGEQLWVRTDCILAERATTNEIIAFFYTSDHTDEQLQDDMLEDLSRHSFERTCAIFVNQRLLRPIRELTASYSPWWDGVDYDEGVRRYAEDVVTEDLKSHVIEQMLLKTIVEELEKSPRYVIQYDVMDEKGAPHRKETEFSYSDREAGIILMSRTDIAAYEGMRYLSEHDPLTGLHNRSKLFIDARHLIDENPDTSFLFVHLDIDRFHLYNSSFGEAEGDRLLRFMGDKVREFFEDKPLGAYGRMSNDVFCFLAPVSLPELEKGVSSLAEQLSSFREDYSLRLLCGAYEVEDRSLPLEDIASKASIAAKKSKRNYTSDVSMFDSEAEHNERREMVIAAEMEHALEDEQFKVFLQPKYLVAGDVPHGAEALVRWKHPERGLISPGEFIPVFERNGFISKLDYYMWDHLSALLKRWRSEGYDPSPISVNVSRVSLYNPHLVNILQGIVKKHDIPASLLQLEITETTYMTNPEMMRSTINRLHDAGFTILMDDFGSGYSSLNTLKDFPIDILKVDMAFLPKEGNVKKGEIIIASVIRMAQWLGMSVVMEGVETHEERDFLEGVGCDSIQGYFYSRPIPSEEYEANYIYSTPAPRNLHTHEPRVHKRSTILAVDDSVIARTMIKSILESRYELVILSSAEEALTYLKRNPGTVDLMIVDNLMPGMSGLDMIKYCHDIPELDAIPKFMLTADTEITTHLQAVKLGVKGFFAKPINADVILTYCDRELGSVKGSMLGD